MNSENNLQSKLASNNLKEQHAKLARNLQRVLPDIQGEPVLISLDDNSGIYEQIDMSSQRDFQEYTLAMTEKASTNCALSMFLEPRRKLMQAHNCVDMLEADRTIHLGLDISLPAGSRVVAPLDGVVIESEYEKGKGQYGGMAVLEHVLQDGRKVYAVYGHLDREHLPAVGSRILAGELISVLGDFSSNGDWFTHLHLQVVTTEGRENGYLHKGYIQSDLLPNLEQWVLDPFVLVD